MPDGRLRSRWSPALSVVSDAHQTEFFPDEVGIAICLYGRDLDPKVVSALLGAKPTESHMRVDRTELKTPPPQQGAWIREVRRFEPIDPAVMVEELLAPLSDDPKIWEALAARFELRLNIGVHTDVGCNFKLAPKTVQALAQRGFSIKFDIYAYGDNRG